MMSMNTGCCLVCDGCGLKVEKLRRWEVNAEALRLNWVRGRLDLCPDCAKKDKAQ